VGFNLQDKGKFVAEINVTPFVDVMLVLLVIFMITAPLMLNAIKMEVPKTKEVNRINLSNSQVILSLTKDGSLYVGDKKFPQDRVLGALNKELTKTRDKTLFLRADYDISYGKVAKLMSFLKRGGISAIALVTELEKS
jgi:biopolymer transport protein TolR